MKYKAVIDTNVLFSGLYSASGASYRVLRLIVGRKIIPLLSTTLLFEYEEVLRRNKTRFKLSTQDIEDILDAFCLYGEERKIHFLWRPQLADPKDDHVLELAVASGNSDIITYNARDFLKANEFGIVLLEPRQVLEKIK